MSNSFGCCGPGSFSSTLGWRICLQTVTRREVWSCTAHCTACRGLSPKAISPTGARSEEFRPGWPRVLPGILHCFDGGLKGGGVGWPRLICVHMWGSVEVTGGPEGNSWRTRNHRPNFNKFIVHWNKTKISRYRKYHQMVTPSGGVYNADIVQCWFPFILKTEVRFWWRSEMRLLTRIFILYLDKS